MSRIVVSMGRTSNIDYDRNFGQILACRILMGTVEAAFLPCSIYYCSLFYTRRELALRTSVFFQMGFIAVSQHRMSKGSARTMLKIPKGAVSGLTSWSVFQWDGKLKVCKVSPFVN